MARYIDADALKLDIDLSKGARIVDMALSAIKAIHEAPTADVAEVKWIPVTERLPKGRREYLCICVFGESKRQYYDVLMFHPEQNAENGYVTGPHFSNEGMGGMRVTHWMPLPKPPSGAKMDGKEDA